MGHEVEMSMRAGHVNGDEPPWWRLGGELAPVTAADMRLVSIARERSLASEVDARMADVSG